MNFQRPNQHEAAAAVFDLSAGSRPLRTGMKLFGLMPLVCTCMVCSPAKAQTNVGVLTTEHVDCPKILYTAAGTNNLTIVARDENRGINYGGTNVFLVAKAEAKLALPAGTPFGVAGQPFWILPQSQNPNLLYLGLSAENIPNVFSTPLNIRVTRFEGPGYMMAWQAVGPGQYNIRIDTRDGLDASDGFVPPVGAHEHYNWGFSTTGVYCVTYQVSGTRTGDAQPIFSREETFAFHVLPLPPATNFPIWQRQYWPPGFDPVLTSTNGNVDGDAFENLFEYASGLSPTNANSITNAPLFSFVSTNGQQFGALTFTRYQPALDLNYAAEVSGELPGAWALLTNLFSVEPRANGITERVTWRDSLLATNGVQRFYRLKATLF
jgi:surface-anchored protein